MRHRPQEVSLPPKSCLYADVADTAAPDPNRTSKVASTSTATSYGNDADGDPDMTARVAEYVDEQVRRTDDRASLVPEFLGQS